MAACSAGDQSGLMCEVRQNSAGSRPIAKKQHEETVGNQPGGQVRKHPHTFPTVIFIDDVGHDEHRLPVQKHPRREREGEAALPRK